MRLASRRAASHLMLVAWGPSLTLIRMQSMTGRKRASLHVAPGPHGDMVVSGQALLAGGAKVMDSDAFHTGLSRSTVKRWRMASPALRCRSG